MRLLMTYLGWFIMFQPIAWFGLYTFSPYFGLKDFLWEAFKLCILFPAISFIAASIIAIGVCISTGALS